MVGEVDGAKPIEVIPDICMLRAQKQKPRGL